MLMSQLWKNSNKIPQGQFELITDPKNVVSKLSNNVKHIYIQKYLKKMWPFRCWYSSNYICEKEALNFLKDCHTTGVPGVGQKQKLASSHYSAQTQTPQWLE